MPDEVSIEDAGDAAAPRTELSDDPQEAARLLEEERSSSARLVDDLQRLAAEFENYRKRAARERDEIVDRASQHLVVALLPVLDSFDQAVTHDPQTPGEEHLLAGMKSTHDQLLDVLVAAGLEPVPSEGSFDPEVHEAVSGGGDGPLVVDQVLRRGYLLRGRVVRPALVSVAEESSDT